VIQLEEVSKGYGGQTLFREVSWRLGGRERIGLVGPNGVGKTTLCRILAGIEEPDRGRVTRPRGTSTGYLPQEVAGGTIEGSVLTEVLGGFEDVWRLEREMEDVAAALGKESAGGDGSVVEGLTRRYGELQHRFEALGGYRLEAEGRAILGGLGFRTDEMTRPLSEFSGGWRMRAALGRLLLLRPSVLLLDEPTNHLDLETREALTVALAQFEGTLVLVSHDRHLLRATTEQFLIVADGKLEPFDGDLDDYRDWLFRTKLGGTDDAAEAAVAPAAAAIVPFGKKSKAKNETRGTAVASAPANGRDQKRKAGHAKHR